MSIGAAVLHRRRALDMTLPQLGRAANISALRLSDIEGGRAQPRQSEVERLERALNFSLTPTGPGPNLMQRCLGWLMAKGYL